MWVYTSGQTQEMMWSVLIVIIIGAGGIGWVQFETRRILRNYALVARRINGRVESKARGWRWLLGIFLFPGVSVTGNCNGIEVEVFVKEYGGGYWYLEMRTRCPWALVPLRLVKKMGGFSWSGMDYPVQKLEGFVVTDRTKPVHSNHVVIDGTTYFLNAEDPKTAADLVNRVNVRASLGRLLASFHAIEVGEHDIRLIKMWAWRDGHSDHILQLVDTLVRLTKDVQAG